MGLNLKELIVAGIMPVFKGVGKAQLEDLLQQLHDHEPAVYADTMKGLYSAAKVLHKLADKTKSKIDDGILDTIIEAIEENADQNDVTL